MGKSSAPPPPSPHAVTLLSLSWPGTASREANEAVTARALGHVHTCHEASGLCALLLFPEMSCG